MPDSPTGILNEDCDNDVAVAFQDFDIPLLNLNHGEKPTRTQSIAVEPSPFPINLPSENPAHCHFTLDPLPSELPQSATQILPIKAKEYIDLRAETGDKSGILSWFTPVDRNSVEYLQQVERERDAFQREQEELQKRSALEEAEKDQKRRRDAAERKRKQRARDIQAEIDSGVRDKNGEKKVDKIQIWRRRSTHHCFLHAETS